MESQPKIDWTGVRGAAWDCLNATWKMICFAVWSQGSDYDVERAASHLAAINGARDTFRRAMEILQPGFELAADDSIRHSPVFDALALATVGEGPRPDFRVGATAHETAFELLRRAILWVENGLNDELEEMGAPDNYLEGIDDLHKRSPQTLRDTLCRLEERKSLQCLLSGQQLHVLRQWIDREWAAVSHAPAKDNQGGADGVNMSEPLTQRAQAVYDCILAAGAVFGRQITQETGIDQSTLTKEIIPELKRLRGIVNKPGAGYYSPRHYRPQ